MMSHHMSKACQTLLCPSDFHDRLLVPVTFYFHCTPCIVINMYFLNCIPVVETCGLSIYHSIARKLAERTDFKRFLNNNEVHNGFKSYLFHPKKIEQSQPACSQWSLTLGLRSHYRIELFGAGERECGSPLRSAPLPGCS